MLSFLQTIKTLGTFHLLSEGGMGRKWGGLRKIYGVLRGVYEKFCDLRGGSMKNKRQYLKGGLQNKIPKRCQSCIPT